MKPRDNKGAETGQRGADDDEVCFDVAPADEIQRPA